MTGVSLRWRLTLIGALTIIAALGAAGLALSWLFAEHVERRAGLELQVNLDQVIAALSFAGNRVAIGAPSADPRYAKPYGGLYWQVESGDTLLRSRSLWDQTLTRDAEAPSAAGLIAYVGPDGAPAVGLEQTVHRPGVAPVRVIVAMDRAGLTAASDGFVKDLAPYLIALALALAAAQAIQLAYGLRPLRRIGARVSALNAGAVDRMGEAWPSEVLPLAGEIDALLAAREGDVTRARARAGDLAHGLKTPLQALIGEAARLRGRGEAEAASAIEHVVGAMRVHIDRELARARRAASGGRARAVVAEVVENVRKVIARTPAGAALAWRIHVPAGLAVAMDAADLAEALGALMENAARHAAARVDVSAAAHQGRVDVEIRDDGPGVPEARLSELAQRGRRLDESLPGQGLGLAIAAEIAEAVGGGLLLANTPGGFAARLSLPPAAARS